MAIINGNNTIFATLNGNQFFIDSTLDVVAFVYGWHVDPTISNPAQAITYLADAVGKTPAAMGANSFSYGDWANAFFMPRPCMLKYDGTVDYYLDPNDYTKKADGTASDIADPNYGGNAMMEWPLIWYKFEAGTAEGEGSFYVANYQVDSSYKCWCNYDANNNIIPHFYTAIYNGTGTDKLRSLSGVALTSANGSGGTTGAEEISRATANNTGSSVEWYTDVFSDRLLINALLILISKSLNTQSSYGNGLITGGQSAKEAYITGALDDRGLFWGDTSSNTAPVKVFGMENWWGCAWRRTAGLVGANNDSYAVKLTYGTADGTSANGYNDTGAGYTIIPNRPTYHNYITKMQFSDKGYFPSALGATDLTYWSDFFFSRTYYALLGGSANDGAKAGANDIYLGDAFSNSSWDDTAALSCKPSAGG